MKKCEIYGIQNVANGKWYVGQTTDLSHRKSFHFSCLKGSYHPNMHLQSSFLKYGEDNFEFHVLEEVPENMLDIRECAWINYYKSNQPEFGYNQESGGSLNKQHSKETREKMRLARKLQICKPLSETHKKNISLAKKGIPLSEAHKKKVLVSLANTHKWIRTDTYKKKMSIACKNKKHCKDSEKRL